jgi:hypothetical protein
LRQPHQQTIILALLEYLFLLLAKLEPLVAALVQEQTKQHQQQLFYLVVLVAQVQRQIRVVQ